MKTPVFYLQPHKAIARKLAEAFAESCGAEIQTDLRYLKDAPAIFYGVKPETLHLYREALTRKEDFYYIDNGYFSPGHDGGYFRVTKNAAQHDGSGNASPERFLRHGLTIRPWRTNGKKILITTQTDWWYERHGTTREKWLSEIKLMVDCYSDLPYQIRAKPGKNPAVSIHDDLQDAWALITHCSNTAIDALLYGVPVFVTWPCAALAMGSMNLQLLRNPLTPRGRHQWAYNLAANQWTLEEIRKGDCWKTLS
jgi:hypothetical protein